MIYKNGEYNFTVDNEDIRDAAGWHLTNGQCYEVAQYIEDNMFDLLADAVEELDFEEE